MKINELIKKLVNSRRYSREERVAAYELACMAAELYFENERLKALLKS